MKKINKYISSRLVVFLVLRRKEAGRDSGHFYDPWNCHFSCKGRNDLLHFLHVQELRLFWLLLRVQVTKTSLCWHLLCPVPRSTSTFSLSGLVIGKVSLLFFPVKGYLIINFSGQKNLYRATFSRWHNNRGSVRQIMYLNKPYMI